MRAANSNSPDSLVTEDRVAKEIQHGRFLAQHGAGEIWNWDSPAGNLRWARRVKMLSEHLEPGMSVLELGCGTGYFTRQLARTGADIVAIDVSPELLEIARSNCSEPNVRYEIQNAYRLSYPDAVFDSVVGSSVLHHLEIEPALREIYRVLKPGGKIFFTEPNMLNPQIAVQKNVPWVKRKLGDSPDETAFFRWSLLHLLERAGYRNVRIDPFDFLHPKTPAFLINRIKALGRFLERVPVLSEFAGSLYIRAAKDAPMAVQSQHATDRDATLRNRGCLGENKNLLFWYRELYRDQFRDFPNPSALSILEIGSGTSPLKQFLANVITSDVLDLDYLDLVFDCHEIDKLDAIKDNSLDVITLTNVLHHLKSPILFLSRAASKLKSGGRIIATEPFFSVVSTLIFKYLHHEPVDFRISDPELSHVQGPLSSANIALPWLIFCRTPEWLQPLNDYFDLTRISTRPFSALSYMVTGGISHRLPVPGFLYRMLFRVDLALSRRFPSVCAGFFTVTLTRR
ncbi:MAG TPA: methyltransferase domain-containing protein [Candidatus Udaeobacter sp.]|jgi:ubiquinone/menaquinone biosynthesis C-methylase UbiE|nr:methyltransferase domain-containing protein [Candidatus Udaeobacter sp.]